jgi:prevent-host-death family protein
VRKGGRMKTVTAKELRSRAAAILERVRKGDEVAITMRGKSIAIMKPVGEADRPFNAVGFGMWKGQREMKDVKRWLDERRNERYQR